ncbi:hypothetical protein D3C76_1758040 [compost metagenome]
MRRGWPVTKNNALNAVGVLERRLPGLIINHMQVIYVVVFAVLWMIDPGDGVVSLITLNKDIVLTYAALR